MAGTNPQTQEQPGEARGPSSSQIPPPRTSTTTTKKTTDTPAHSPPVLPNLHLPASAHRGTPPAKGPNGIDRPGSSTTSSAIPPAIKAPTPVPLPFPKAGPAATTTTTASTNSSNTNTPLSSSPQPAAVDPATSSMVLSRLQNMNTAHNAGLHMGHHHPGLTPTPPYPHASSAALSQQQQQQQPAAPELSDFLAQLQHFIPPSSGPSDADFASSAKPPGTSGASTMAPSPPAFVSASQLHPPPVGVAPSATTPGLNPPTTWNATASAPTKANGAAAPADVKKNAPAAKDSSASSPAPQPGSSTGPGTAAGPSSSSVNKQIPAFLNKLRNMVDDKDTDELICWQPNGSTFIVPNNIRFAKEVLPRFFKHNNFSSFVRQLNMYGFHKVPSLQQGSLKHEQEMEVWEFENENFVRDQPDLMSNMQRKRGQKGDGDKDGHDKDDENDRNKALIDGKVEEGLNSVSGALMRTGESESLQQLANVWHAIQSIQSSQATINDNLRHLHLSNDRLWKDAVESKQRAEQQADTINKMLQFLAGVFGGQDVLNHADDGSATPTKGRKKAARPNASLFRNNSGAPLMIESSGGEEDEGQDQYNRGGQRASSSGGDRGTDNSERIQELFSRFSEEAGSNENTPRGSKSPPESSTPRFTKLASPSTNSAPFTPTGAQHSSWDDGQASRRPSTPSGGRGKISGNQILSALQQVFANQAANSPHAGGSTPGQGGARPGTPGVGAKIDPALLSSIQNVMNLIQSQQGGGGSGIAGNQGANPGAGGEGQDVNRFLYPYSERGTPANSQSVDANGLGNVFSQCLDRTQNDADGLQRAINALVSVTGSGGGPPGGTAGINATPGPGALARPGTPGLFSSGMLPSGNTPAASGSVAPGDWNQYAALTPSNAFGPSSHLNQNGSNPDLSNDVDMDALLSQFISSSPAPAGLQNEPNPMDDASLNSSAAASPRTGTGSGASTGAAVSSPATRERSLPVGGGARKRHSDDEDDLQPNAKQAKRGGSKNGKSPSTSYGQTSVEDA